MTFLKRAAAALLATTAVAALATPSLAQDFKGKSAGDILVRGRFLALVPQVSGQVNTGAPVNAPVGDAVVSNAYIPEIDFSYFVTDNIALELIAGTSRHSVSTTNTLAPTLGNIQVGKVWLLPPTLTVQYHFFSKSRVSPYIGGGVNYTFFYNANPANTGPLPVTSVKFKNNWGGAVQAGFDVALGGNWSFNVDLKKIFLSTTVNATVAGVIPATSSARIDPWVVGFGVGYRF